jgi:hypothetical protein
MRIYLRVDQATKALSRMPQPRSGQKEYKRGVIIQVLGAGTCWFDTDRAPIENTDSLGIPTAGSSIDSTRGAINFDQWNDDLWLRGSTTGMAVEITPLGVR